MDLIKNLEGRILTDGEFLEYLDYALDAVRDFEVAAEECCAALRRRAAEFA